MTYDKGQNHGPVRSEWPRWLPDAARRYLAHTEKGRSIRDLARIDGCHASTVLRQIRRLEAQRDDPLIDRALNSLAKKSQSALQTHRLDDQGKDQVLTSSPMKASCDAEAADPYAPDAHRILRRLCETGAVLAVAEDMEKAVVVREDAQGRTTRSAVVLRPMAEALALQGWISCPNPGRISRYQITAAGRAALGQMLAKEENEKRVSVENGFADDQASFAHAGASDKPKGGPRFASGDSPLIALARRRDKTGAPFLTDNLVRAGERLREDFELAQIGSGTTQNWDAFLTAGVTGRMQSTDGPAMPGAARARVEQALAELGPGLSDVALRCCCYLQGLENVEKNLGWSARSGKIVLRIALQRLSRHYADLSSQHHMIG